MRDIADTLAFLAIKTLTDGGFDLGPDRKDMRRTLTGAFEDLLDRLPEGAITDSAPSPLGYLVMAKRDTGASAVGPVWPDRRRAEGHLARISGDSEKHPGIWHGAEFVLAEVREVQP